MKLSNLIVLFVATASLAFGQHRGMHKPMPEGHPGMGEMRQLDLTDDQQPKFDKLTSSLEKKQIALRSKIMTARVDLRDLMREEMPDEPKVIAKQKEINDLQGELKTNRTAFWFDVNAMLTPEQRKDWKREGRDAMRKHMFPRKEMMHEMGRERDNE